MSNSARLSDDWREWSRAKLEYEYSPSQWSKLTYDDYAPLFKAASDSARENLGSKLNLDSYGQRPRNLVAWTAPTSRNEIFIWIHGGYWQGSSIDESLIGADELTGQGFGFAAIEYTLAPDASLAQIVGECGAAIDWIDKQNPGRSLFLGGHSAGAHLALAARREVDGLVLVSGVYDLRPIVSTSINDALGIDEAVAQALSPTFTVSSLTCPAEVIVGGDESSSFHAQSAAAVDYLTRGGSPVVLRIVPGGDHFDIILGGEHISAFLRLVDR